MTNHPSTWEAEAKAQRARAEAAEAELERLRDALSHVEAVINRPDQSKHNKPEGGVYIYAWGRIELAIRKARAALADAQEDET